MLRPLARYADARPAQWLKSVWAGLLLAVVIAAAALFVGSQHGGPTLLYALLLGMAFNFLAQDARFQPGIDLAARTILRAGVALLGLRINIELLAALGPIPVALVVAAVLGTLAVSLVGARALGLSRELGLLTGAGTAICGASAAMAVSSVMPHSPTRERHTLFAVVGVTTLSTIAMVVYPLILAAMDTSPVVAGVVIGATIHDVAQVTGAGFMLSETSGETATVTKLMRVTLLMPTVLVTSVAVAGLVSGPATAGSAQAGETGAGTASSQTRLKVLATAVRAGLPSFVLAFGALATVTSLGLVPSGVTDAGSALSRGCLVTAISALGVKTSLAAMASIGWRPIALIVIQTLALAVGIGGAALWLLA